MSDGVRREREERERDEDPEISAPVSQFTRTRRFFDVPLACSVYVPFQHTVRGLRFFLVFAFCWAHGSSTGTGCGSGSGSRAPIGAVGDDGKSIIFGGGDAEPGLGRGLGTGAGFGTEPVRGNGNGNGDGNGCA